MWRVIVTNLVHEPWIVSSNSLVLLLCFLQSYFASFPYFTNSREQMVIACVSSLCMNTLRSMDDISGEFLVHVHVLVVLGED